MKNIRQLLTSLLAVFLLASCANVQKAVDTGNYDQAIKIAVKKLRGKTKKKEKYVRALEVGFYKANKRDMGRIEALKRRNDADSWEKINYLARQIDNRQLLIQPLLPVVDREGYNAKFKFVNAEQIIVESEDRAANFIYDEAREYLAKAKRGDKSAARSAYAAFNRINKYKQNYKDSRDLKEEARELGIVNIAYKVVNRSDAHLPKQVTRELEQFGVANLNTFWKQFHVNPGNVRDMDYQFKMIVDLVDVGPSLVKEREFAESKEIEDGWKYVLDENGNVLKDSLGNDVKEPNFRWVNAEILETNQIKEVFLGARMELVDLKRKQVVDTEKFRGQAVFKHCAATFRGDRRALSPGTLQHLNNHPLPFPDDRLMLRDAASQMKPQIQDRIDSMILI